MPNPKIQVTLEPELYDLLHETSQATGKSMSSLVVEILKAQKLSLKMLTKAHRALKRPVKRDVSDIIEERDFLENQGELPE